MCIPTHHPANYGYRKNEYQRVAAAAGDKPTGATDETDETEATT